ncbi:hypothetical protein [Streptomyces sp. LARHCF252]
MADRLAATRPVTREHAAADVTALLDHLREEALVTAS